MNHINQITLLGRIVGEPTALTADGREYAALYTLEVDGVRHTVRVTSHEMNYARKYLHTGSIVSISGRLCYGVDVLQHTGPYVMASHVTLVRS